MTQKRFLITIIILSAILISGCLTNGEYIDTADLLYNNLTWKLQLDVPAGSIDSFHCFIKGDMLYYGLPDGNFYALDMDSGSMQWIFQTGGEINSIPFADEENVYFGSNDGFLYAVSREHGRLAWSFNAEKTIQSSVLKYKDIIIFVSDIGYIYYVSAEDGELIDKTINSDWLCVTFIINDGIAYYLPNPDIPYTIGAYDIDNRKFLWFLDTFYRDICWFSIPVVSGELLYYGTYSNFSNYSFYYNAANRLTGERVWENYEVLNDDLRNNSDYNINFYERFFRLSDFMMPCIWKDAVIFTNGDFTIRAFNTGTGVNLWKRDFEYPICSAPTAAQGNVYFGTFGGQSKMPELVCVSAVNGDVLWQTDLEGAVLNAPVINGKWMVFCTDIGVLYIYSADKH